MRQLEWFCVLAITCGLANSLQAQDAESVESPAQLSGIIEPVEPESDDSDATVPQSGQVKIGDRQIQYDIKAESIVVKGTSEKSEATIRYIAYHVKSDQPRPLTFCFNGGPGSSSVWLHMGLVGPKRVLADVGQKHQGPFTLAENPYSLLDQTDVVLVDPVSTGLSRPKEAKKGSEFHGYDGDINSLGQFIEAYLRKYHRWNSPVYLMGESYGTLRVSALARHLQGRYRIDVAGLILISAVLDFQTIAFTTANDLAYVMFFPSYAATSWYHGKLGDEYQKDFGKLRKQAEKFATNEYLLALLKGASIDPQSKQRVAEKYARLTGLPIEYILANNLRVPMHRFGKQLLRDEEQLVGRFDSRYKQFTVNSYGESTEFDPSATAMFGPYTAAFNHYAQDELGLKLDETYEILTSKVRPWSYESFENDFVNVLDPLQRAMIANPRMKVFVAAGWMDLATPYLAVQHSIHHLQLPKQVEQNIDFKAYPAGHMMYVHEPSLKQLRADLVEYYNQ